MGSFLSVFVAVALAAPVATPVPAADPRSIDPAASHPKGLDLRTAQPVALPEPAAPTTTPTTTTSAPPPKIDRADVLPGEPADPSAGCWATKGQCRQLTITGIVLTSLGAASVIAGGALYAIPNKPYPGQPAFEKSYRPVGVMMMAMGVGIVVTGALMIIAGKLGKKKSFRWGFGKRLRGKGKP